MGNALEWTVDLYRENLPDQPEGWVQEGGVTYRAYRGLPVNEKMPKKGIPRTGAAFRQALCATGPCPDGTESILEWVGFRCVRGVK